MNENNIQHTFNPLQTIVALDEIKNQIRQSYPDLSLHIIIDICIYGGYELSLKAGEIILFHTGGETLQKRVFKFLDFWRTNPDLLNQYKRK
jgi:hypothetical protein